MGTSVDEIATEHGITLSAIYVALTYYYDYRKEIDETILANETFVAELRRKTSSKLKDKIGG